MSSTFRPLRARAGISLFFFTNGAMMAGLLPRYPEVKAAFGLTNTEFGLMVAIGPLASMLASALVSSLAASPAAASSPGRSPRRGQSGRR